MRAKSIRWKRWLTTTLASKPQEAATDSALPRVIIERFAIEQDMLAMVDRQAGYRNGLTPINFTLNNFNTLSELAVYLKRHTDIGPTGIARAGRVLGATQGER